MCCDAGASPYELLFPPDEWSEEDKLQLSDFRRIILRPGTGHEDAIYLRMVTAIAWALGAGELAEKHGFKMPGSKKYLKSGRNLHKTLDFLMFVARPAILNTFWREYATTLPADAALTVDGFLAWVRQDHGDRAFAAQASFWVLDVVPAYALVRSGIRSNVYTAYAAGRKVLLPLLFARNHRIYSKLVLEDIAQLEYRRGPMRRAPRWHRERTAAGGVQRA